MCHLYSLSLYQTKMKYMSKTNQLVRVVTKALNESPTGVSFFGVNGYENQNGEVSNFVINIGASYQNAKKKDIVYLENLNVSEEYWYKINVDEMDLALFEEARIQLLASLINPNKAQSQAQKDAYTHINSAIKIHNVTDAIYIFGTRVSKHVLVKGDYSNSRTSNPRPLTKAKNIIRENMKSTKYRQFKIETQPEAVTYSGASETIIVEMVN